MAFTLIQFTLAPRKKFPEQLKIPAWHAFGNIFRQLPPGQSAHVKNIRSVFILQQSLHALIMEHLLHRGRRLGQQPVPVNGAQLGRPDGILTDLFQPGGQPAFIHG